MGAIKISIFLLLSSHFLLLCLVLLQAELLDIHRLNALCLKTFLELTGRVIDQTEGLDFLLFKLCVVLHTIVN